MFFLCTVLFPQVGIVVFDFSKKRDVHDLLFSRKNCMCAHVCFVCVLVIIDKKKKKKEVSNTQDNDILYSIFLHTKREIYGKLRSH
jgi:hypothetical protein